MIKFGTGGFRGIIDEDFTEKNIIKITSGIAKYLLSTNGKKQVAVSYDKRRMSFEASQLVSDILSSYGFNVILSNKPTPTPVVMYYVKKHELNLGIMITASHNPSEYNGIKVFEKGGKDASVELTHALELFINTEHETHSAKNELISEVDILDDYLTYVKTFIEIKQNAKNKILVDFIHGTGMQTIPYFKVFYDLAYMDFARMNEKNTNILPNPTEQVMNQNRSIQKDENYEIVMGMDADADRLGILDEHGNYVNNNEILALIYYYLVKYKGLKGDIVKNIATSNLIDNVALKLGFKCHTVDVGFKNISQKMEDVDALIGGESSGGLTLRNYISGKDATLSTLLIIEVLTRMKKTFSELIKELKKFAEYDSFYTEDEIHYQNKEAIINQLKSINFMETYKLEILNNNYKYIFENNDWVLLRFSGTEPIIRTISETNQKDKGSLFINILKNQIRGL